MNETNKDLILLETGDLQLIQLQNSKSLFFCFQGFNFFFFNMEEIFITIIGMFFSQTFYLNIDVK